MNRDEIITSIKSYRSRADRSARIAVSDIRERAYEGAIMALTDAAKYEAIAQEYEFQLEAMEVNHD